MSDDPSPEDLPPAYFLSLTLENVRCFGPEQTPNLTDDDGTPAQWTVLLGDNGTGKTTLLQAGGRGLHAAVGTSVLDFRQSRPIPHARQ